MIFFSIELRRILGVMILVAAVTGCERNNDDVTVDAENGAETATTAERDVPATQAPGAASVIDVVVSDFTIEAPAEVPAGWTTVRLANKGQQTHFVVFYRIVDGKTIEDQQREVVPHFDAAMIALQSGEVDKAGAGEMLGAIPAWAFAAKYRGGPGLLAPGRTATTTINLDEPGTYLMECYVKSTDGTFHTSMGMLREIKVTAPASAAVEPDADIELTLTNAGIAMSEEPAAGRHVVRVNFAEDPKGFLPYDVHLVRLTDDTDMEQIVEWMDWMNVGGLRAPAPAEFLGGAENTPAGHHAYITVDLEPGRYAWISEINADRMLHEFTVE